jgi:L-arabinose transport system permease protein
MDNKTRLIRMVNMADKLGMFIVFLILFAGCALFVDNFFSRFNMISLALAVSTTGIVACTMLFCLASGDFDLSVGTIVPCSGVLVALLLQKFKGMDPLSATLTASLLTLLAGAAIGFVNGFFVAKCKINALITTLSTMLIVKGIGFILADGKSISVANEAFMQLGNALFLGIPMPIWITVICFVFFGLLLAHTTYGRNTLAIGGNPEAARLAGINVDRTRILIFSLQGFIAAFAGVIAASRMQIGDPKAFQGFELQVISACVLGGVSLSGGIGSMVFVITGVLIMGTVENAMNLKNIDSFYQLVVRGAILLAAVLFDKFKQRIYSMS